MIKPALESLVQRQMTILGKLRASAILRGVVLGSDGEEGKVWREKVRSSRRLFWPCRYFLLTLTRPSLPGAMQTFSHHARLAMDSELAKKDDKVAALLKEDAEGEGRENVMSWLDAHLVRSGESRPPNQSRRSDN